MWELTEDMGERRDTHTIPETILHKVFLSKEVQCKQNNVYTVLGT